ncbi:hypothetical protein PC121_g20964 [Phytophthora cactorum]|nr:hypothetical protein PC120_g20578 [Phytophthora cactorum]KAG3045958.1 hypothetical protein PC121_g20964 [Phytophthora cactorum]KAG4043467.1 hypothetical protein PC123_g21056 [Phytophthora cactorum]
MRLSCIILVAAATATLLTSCKAAAAASDRTFDISTMASPDVIVSLGAAQGIGG